MFRLFLKKLFSDWLRIKEGTCMVQCHKYWRRSCST